LHEPVRQAARRAYALFAQNPDHPSLRFKKLAGYDRVWSVRINEQYRAVGERDGDTIVWAWIGTHNEFDNLFG
jgi:plasmid maintenance system killer protein